MDGSHIIGDYSCSGAIGGVDFYEWVYNNSNYEALSGVKGITPMEKREFGLAFGSADGNTGVSVYVDKLGDMYVFDLHLPKRAKEDYGIHAFEGNYGTVQSNTGKTPNEMISSGEWEGISFRDLIKKRYPEFTVPDIKITYYNEAKYADYPPSKNDPSQGFFYDEDDLKAQEELALKRGPDFYEKPIEKK